MIDVANFSNYDSFMKKEIIWKTSDYWKGEDLLGIVCAAYYYYCYI